MKRVSKSDLITVQRLEAALAIVARAIVLDGAVYAPIFDRLVQQIVELRADDDAVSRAERYLAAYAEGSAGGSRPECDPSGSDKGKFDSALVVELLRGPG